MIDEGEVEYTQATCDGAVLKKKVEVTGTLEQPDDGTGTIAWDGYGPFGDEDRTVTIDDARVGLRGVLYAMGFETARL